jgi:hypothetical protein
MVPNDRVFAWAFQVLEKSISENELLKIAALPIENQWLEMRWRLPVQALEKLAEILEEM